MFGWVALVLVVCVCWFGFGVVWSCCFKVSFGVRVVWLYFDFVGCCLIVLLGDVAFWCCVVICLLCVC